MASPARSDETWSLVATTRELVVMAPLASGEVMTAPLRCGWVRDCGGEVRVLQRDGALAGGPAGVSRGGAGGGSAEARAPGSGCRPDAASVGASRDSTSRPGSRGRARKTQTMRTRLGA